MDFGFIDANKDQYDEYYEKLLLLLRPGGIIAVDNVLWDCRVLNPHPEEESTKVGERALPLQCCLAAPWDNAAATVHAPCSS